MIGNESSRGLQPATTFQLGTPRSLVNRVFREVRYMMVRIKKFLSSRIAGIEPLLDGLGRIGGSFLKRDDRVVRGLRSFVPGRYQCCIHTRFVGIRNLDQIRSSGICTFEYIR